MNKTYSFGKTMKQYLFAALMLSFLFAGVSAAIWSPASFANTIGGSNGDEVVADSGGVTIGRPTQPSSPAIPPAPAAPPPAGNPSVYYPPGSGAGGDYYLPPYTQNWPGSLCPRRDDGKAALTTRITYAKHMQPIRDGQALNNMSGWRFEFRVPNYKVYSKVEEISRKCLYPPRVYYATVQCSIAYYVDIYRSVPNPKAFGYSEGRTGYAEGSYNYNACVNSRGLAQVNSPVTEYGFYSVRAWQRAANARVEIAYTPNEVTGALPGPKIVSLSPAFVTSKRVLATASLDCRNGFRSPGLTGISDWTDAPCGPGSGFGASYTCSPQPVLFDIADGTGRNMQSFTGNSTQFLRDGKSREMTFRQSVSGSQITVQNQRTHFLRGAGSTPWDHSALHSKNLFELADRNNGPSILSKGLGTATGTYSGNKQNVWARGYAAGEVGSPTTITQRIDWNGLRTIRSANVTGVNPNTGQVNFTYVTRQVPTSGVCNQTATLDYIRAIGDAVR